MFTHLFVAKKTARGKGGDFPELVAETQSWTLADGILSQDGYHRLTYLLLNS